MDRGEVSSKECTRTGTLTESKVLWRNIKVGYGYLRRVGWEPLLVVFIGLLQSTRHVSGSCYFSRRRCRRLGVVDGGGLGRLVDSLVVCRLFSV